MDDSMKLFVKKIKTIQEFLDEWEEWKVYFLDPRNEDVKIAKSTEFWFWADEVMASFSVINDDLTDAISRLSLNERSLKRANNYIEMLEAKYGE